MGPLDTYESLDRKQLFILLISILIVALCGIAYELIIGTVSSYLLGNSVYQFSLTIGLFMFAMGIGSYLSKFFMKNLITNFIGVEIVISLIGGISSILLFMTFPLMTALYSMVMYLLILLIGTLVGLEIPILTRILSQKDTLRQSIAHVLSLDYIGALIGSIIFPLFLLPQLGLIRSSFAVGLINAGTAVINTHFFKEHLKYPRMMMGASIGFMVFLTILTASGSYLTRYAENHLYFDQIIYKKQTTYQNIVYTKSMITGEHRLYIDGHIQFSHRDEYRYHEALVHPAMSAPGPRNHVLILGGGDGMAAREVLKYEDVKTIHLVDIDPEITRFCGTFPEIVRLNGDSLSHPKLTVINQDAFTFANQPGIRYDRMIIDLPDPHNESLNKLYSREFYKILSMRLQSHGVVVTQGSSPFYTRKTYWCIERTLKEVFSSTCSYQITVPSFGIWGFHLAARNEAALKPINIRVPVRFFSNRILKTARIFGKDISPLAGPVNSFMEPKLYMLYLEELSSGS